MSEPRKPGVGHFVREWLRPTETFIHSTVVNASAYTPHVLCCFRTHLDLYPFPRLVASHSRLSGASGLVTRGLYRSCRTSAGAECRLFEAYCREHGIRVIHAHFGVDARYILKLRLRSRLPMVVSWYGYDASSFPATYAGLGRRYLRPLFPAVERHLVPSGHMASQLERIGAPRDRLTVLPWGVDTALFRPPESPRPDRGEVVFAMVSGFTYKKGIHVLLPAFQKLLASLPDARLTLGGDGPLRSEMQDLASALGIAARVEFVGRLSSPEVARLLLGSDVFVHPSLTSPTGETEGIPTAILEAMAARMPIVATDHAGISELGLDPQGGRVVPEGSVEALAAALGEIARAKPRWPAMGAFNRQIVLEGFDTRGQMRKRERLYDQLVAGR